MSDVPPIAYESFSKKGTLFWFLTAVALGEVNGVTFCVGHEIRRREGLADQDTNGELYPNGASPEGTLRARIPDKMDRIPTSCLEPILEKRGSAIPMSAAPFLPRCSISSRCPAMIGALSAAEIPRYHEIISILALEAELVEPQSEDPRLPRDGNDIPVLGTFLAAKVGAGFAPRNTPTRAHSAVLL